MTDQKSKEGIFRNLFGNDVQEAQLDFKYLVTDSQPAMHRSALGLAILVLTLTFIGCKKDDDPVLIPNNTAPPDGTISTVTKETYVNRAYISLLGREPIDSERESALAILSKDNLSQSNREEFLDEILAKDNYEVRLYEIARTELLDALDTAEITTNIAIFEFLLTDSSNIAIWDALNYEIDRMEEMKTIPSELANGSLDVIGLHRKCVNNYFYDQLNMGTENFVVSMFQNFLLRYPTIAELDEGKLIVDGLGGLLFLEQGNSKDDFLDIFFDSSDYFEGQVRDLYLRYLFREPDTKEVIPLANAYQQNKDFGQLQKAILSLDEYIGIE